MVDRATGMSGETFSAGTAPVTWTQISNTFANRGHLMEYGAAGAAGTYTGQCYKSSTGYDTSIMTVAFKPGGQAATPTFSPAAGTYASSQTVTISDSTSGSTIYYTTNGTTPTTASSTYSSAITVSANETLEAIATASGYTTERSRFGGIYHQRTRGHAWLQSRGRGLWSSAECDHQRWNLGRNHLLHHQRNHAYDQFEHL